MADIRRIASSWVADVRVRRRGLARRAYQRTRLLAGGRAASSGRDRLRCTVVAVWLASLLLLVRPPEVAGSGYGVDERSASAAGTAFAGATTGTDDASYLTHNPAALASQEGYQLLSEGALIVPSLDLHRGAASTLNFGPPVGSVPVSGRSRADAAVPALVPALYGLWPVTPDLKVGLGVTSPFGLTTEYPSDWVGRYHGVRSELLTVNLNPVVAYRVTRWLGLGADFQAQYIKTTLTNAVDVGSIAFAATDRKSVV